MHTHLSTSTISLTRVWSSSMPSRASGLRIAASLQATNTAASAVCSGAEENMAVSSLCLLSEAAACVPLEPACNRLLSNASCSEELLIGWVWRGRAQARQRTPRHLSKQAEQGMVWWGADGQ